MGSSVFLHTLGHIFRLPECTAKVGALAIYLVFDLVTNRGQEKYLSFHVPRVPMPFGGSLRHPLRLYAFLPKSFPTEFCTWHAGTQQTPNLARVLACCFGLVGGCRTEMQDPGSRPFEQSRFEDKQPHAMCDASFAMVQDRTGQGRTGQDIQ